MHMSAWMRAKATPAASANRSPTRALLESHAPTTPANAAMSMRPSRPMLTTPERSLNMPPKAAKTRGVALRIVEAKREPKEPKRSSILLAHSSLQVGARGEGAGALAHDELDQLRGCYQE